jgi:16S rRNA (uracil1498-N3)-methyltransferase
MTPRTHRLPRLFVDRDLDGFSLTLDEDEAHYLGTVLRLGRDDELIAFNGRGRERHASIASMQRRGATLELKSEHPPMPESRLDFTLVQALPKSDAMDLIVQKATELGVRALLPVYTEFSVVKLDTERSERRVDHWRKIARSACEQCGRHTPPRIETPRPLQAAIEALPAGPERVALEPSAERSLGEQAPPKEGLVVAVGPEGGFGAADWRRLDAAQFRRATLGSRVLRAETAALAVCAIAQSRWGDLRL